MPKTAIARRQAPSADAALARRLTALGLTEEVIREAVDLHVRAMREAVSTRGAVDWTARQRSADALLSLAQLASGATDPMGKDDGERGPLVSLTLVQAPEQPRRVVEAEP